MIEGPTAEGSPRPTSLTTPLTDRHREAGAKLVDFAGWSMPIRFAGTMAEHAAVRDDVGVFDVSHLGTVWVEGEDAEQVVGHAFTNDPSRVGDGSSQYTLCCDEQGGVIDDLLVYRVRADRWLAVPNAANTAAVLEVLERAAAAHDAAIVDASTDLAVLAIQGPRAFEVTDAALAGARIAAPPVADVAHLGLAEPERDGATGVVARTGYTGERGCELVVPGSWAPALWDAALDAGATPCGLGARDTLRLEMGFPLHGNELSRDTSPYEARLGWAVKLDRGPFEGSEALARRKAEGPSRRSWGLLVDGRRPARPGMEVRVDGEVVGHVTSGTLSPTLGRPIALALLDAGTGPGDRVTLDLRGNDVEGEVVRPPFVDRDPKG